MIGATYADVLRPSAKAQNVYYDAVLVVGGSAFIALCGQLSVRLPFSPVPITGQTLSVLLVGAVLGSRRGVLSAITYLIQGIVGLPVFAGGTSGIAHLLGPTGGYLVGFVAAAYLTGKLAQRGWDRRVATTFLAMLLGNLVLYVLGLSWLSIFVGARKVLQLGLYPHIPGDLAKLIIAALSLPLAWSLQGKMHR